jgi:uncharacterized protein YciI
MLYMILAKDSGNTLDLRQTAAPAQAAYLRTLRDEGRLLLAGPLPAIDATDPGPAGFRGSLIIAEFNSLEDAHAWFMDAPYQRAHAYAQVDILPFVAMEPL